MDILTLTADEQVKNVTFSEDSVCVDLMDGRTISAPLMWYPKLYHASADELANWQVSGRDHGIHWSDIDANLSTEGLRRGTPAPGQQRNMAVA